MGEGYGCPDCDEPIGPRFHEHEPQDLREHLIRDHDAMYARGTLEQEHTARHGGAGSGEGADQ